MSFVPGGADDVSNFTLANNKTYTVIFDTARNWIASNNMSITNSNSAPVNQGIAFDNNDGSYAVTGYNNLNGLQIDNTNLFLNNAGGFVVKYDANGTGVWEHETGTGRGLDVDIDADGNVYTSGWLDGAPFAGFGLGLNAFGNPVEYNATGNSATGTGRHAYWGMFDKYGNAMWAEFVGGVDMRASNIIFTDNGPLAVSGEYNDSFDAYQLNAIPYNNNIEVYNFLLNYQQPDCFGVGFDTELIDTILCEGNDFSYTVDVSYDSASTTYEWIDLNTGNPVPGQTSNTFDITGAVEADGGFFQLVATNGCGQTQTSNTLRIGVTDAPLVLLPDTANGCESLLGNNFGSLRPQIVSAGTTTYEWFKDGTSLGTQTEPAYEFSPYTNADAGTYVISVTDACGTTDDTVVVVTQDQPYIVQDFPAQFELCSGQTAQLLATVGSIDTLAFDLIFNGAVNSSLTGQTGSQFGITLDGNVPAIFGATVRLDFSGSCANVSTTTTTIVQGAANPTIDTQPVDATVNAGDDASFTVEASGSDLTYQWLKDGVALTDGGNISGATTATLTISNAAAADAGDYTVEVTGGCANGTVTSDPATLTIGGCEDPAIVAAPTGAATRPAGTILNLNVTATGDGLVYQWFKDVTAMTDGGNITGATAATLTLDPLAQADAGTYYCEVSGDCGSPVQTGDYVLTIGPASRPDLSAVGISVYPNPTEGTLFVEFEAAQRTELSAVLMDLSGRTIQAWDALNTTAGATNTLELNDVATGLYILELRGEGFRAQQRIAVR